MGMYTKINVIIRLQKSKDTLNFFNRDDFYWKNCHSQYFTGTANTKLLDNSFPSHDGEYVLHLDCDMKNYAKDFLIEDFLKEAEKHLCDECKESDYEEFAGYIRRDEDLFPNFVWIKEGKILIDRSYRKSVLDKVDEEETKELGGM